MENSKEFEISTIGKDTGKSYAGTFKVKGILNRRDNFLADAARRRIIGPSPADALPALQGEAYMLGQLQVRILEAPDWWTNNAQGELLEDSNVISEVFELAIKTADEVTKAINDQATAALEKLSKDAK
jgi:hypothetical protein